MKVLRIFHGGVVERYQRRDEELMALGHRVRLIIPTNYRELPTLSVGQARTHGELSVSVCKTVGPRRNPLWWYDRKALSGIVADFMPDVVDVHEEPYSLAMGSVLASIPRSVPMIFRSSQNVAKRYPIPFRNIESEAYSRSRAAYVPTSQAKDVLLAKGFTKPVHVVGNGVEIPRDKVPSSVDVGGTRRVVFAGRYTEQKGLSDLLLAAADVDGLEVHLAGGDYAGPGPLPRNFHDHGVLRYESLTELFRSCHGICVPSRVEKGWSEQFCRSLVEGMAHGLAPLVSTSGALSDVAGPCAMVFSAGSPSSLRASLTRFAEMTDFDLHSSRSAAISQAHQYSWSETSVAINKIYGSVVR